ncbi:MAG: UPF0175 family protein [Chloroflexi bacterium]|nr:UPF0175 family protein [Chloroflexota bacterium]
MQTLIITVSDELADQLQPYQEYLDTLLLAGLREARLGQSLALFKQGHISVWKAVRLAGVSLREMIQYLNANGFKPDVDEQTIREDLA